MRIANYSLPEIADFLTSEREALHGISPEVHVQNTAIVRQLGSVAATVGEGVLAVQLFGSRTAGYSDLGSDIDINVIATDDSTRKSATQLIIDHMTESAPGLITENVACIIARIDNPVPSSPDEFTDWIMADWGPHGIFEDGLIPSDSLRLTRLAALEVINKHTAQYQREDVYARIRERHAKTFLGDLPRMQRKLAKRLGESVIDVTAAISESIYQERRDSFGMPPQFTTHYAQLSAWAAQNSVGLEHLTAYNLYHSLHKI